MVLENMFKKKKKSRAPAVKISVMETSFEKGVNKILLQKKLFFLEKNKYKKKKRERFQSNNSFLESNK